MSAVTGPGGVAVGLDLGQARPVPRGLWVRVGVLALTVAAGGRAQAQIDGEQAQAMAEADDQAKRLEPRGSFGGELGFGGLGEDYFLTLNLRFSWDRDNWGVGVQAPLRLRVWDRDPKNDDYGGILRHEDWDQPSDFLRILRYVYIGQRDKRGPYYVRLGELAGLTVGHGTIMHRYFNGIDANKWRTGVNAVVNIGPYSGELVVGDLLDPYLFGARFTMRPAVVLHQLLGGGGALAPEPAEEQAPGSAPRTAPAPSSGVSDWAARLVVGHSLFTDTRAPIELSTDATGGVVTNDDGVPLVTRERALIVLGLLDVGYELVQTEMFTVTPYMDLNKVTEVQHGWGWHLGVLSGLRLPLGFADFSASLRTEYRFVSGDYVAPYFNVVYEIERYQRLSAARGDVQPKLQSLCGGTPACDSAVGPSRHGYFFEGSATLEDWVSVGFEYLDYSGPRPDGQFRLSVDVPALEFVQLSAYYYRINVEGPGDLFAIDDKSAIVAQAQIPVYWLLAVQLRWWRVWRSCGDGATQCTDGEGFQSVDDWSVGLGFNYTF